MNPSPSSAKGTAPWPPSIESFSSATSPAILNSERRAPARSCSLRLAVNDRVKNKDSGAWKDHANSFTVSVFGTQCERCAQYLAKGRQVAIDGRLHWRSWEAKDGSKREAVEVVADTVQFIGAREGDSQREATASTAEDARGNRGRLRR